MTRLNLSALTLAALTSLAAAALAAQQSPDLTPYLIADRNAEIAFGAALRASAGRSAVGLSASNQRLRNCSSAAGSRAERVSKWAGRGSAVSLAGARSVSYTHLTLPTICSV